MSCTKRTKNSGWILFLVCFVFLFFSTLAIQFYTSARHSQAMVFRFKKSEIIRRIAEIAIKEAVYRFSQKTNTMNPTLLDFFSGSGQNKLLVPVPVISSLAPNWVGSQFLLKIEVEVSRVDYRNFIYNLKRKEKVDYYGKDGVGTLQFKAVVSVSLNGKMVANCTFIRHHDFKLASVLSARQNSQSREKYSPSYPLDYVLFVRKGLKEFRDTKNGSLNPDPNQLRLEIHQGDHDNIPPEKFGKIFFGGTAPSSSGGAGDQDFVYLNIGEAEKDFIPPICPPNDKFYISWGELCALLPSAFAFMNTPYGDPNNVKGKLRGFFHGENVPAIRSQPPGNSMLPQTEQFVREALTQPPAIETNTYPGIQLLSGNDRFTARFSEGILEGDIRQRFLHFVYFDLDGKQLIPYGGYVQILYPALLTLPSSFFNNLSLSGQDLAKEFIQGIGPINSAHPNEKIISYYDTDYPLKGEQTWPSPNPNGHVRPKFWDCRNHRKEPTDDDPTVLPFAFESLYSAKFHNRQLLSKIGVLNGDVLYLRGIVCTRFPCLELGGVSPLKVRGQGVLIAESIKINGPIVKDSPDAVCILFSRGEIQINTDKEIDVSLIAMNTNGSGKVLPTKPLNLKGSLAVDILDTANWKSTGPHKIVYDESLKRSDDLYKVSILPWISFERVTEQDLEQKGI